MKEPVDYTHTRVYERLPISLTLFPSLTHGAWEPRSGDDEKGSIFMRFRLFGLCTRDPLGRYRGRGEGVFGRQISSVFSLLGRQT